MYINCHSLTLDTLVQVNVMRIDSGKWTSHSYRAQEILFKGTAAAALYLLQRNENIRCISLLRVSSQHAYTAIVLNICLS